MSRLIGQSTSTHQSALSTLGKELLRAAEDGDEKSVKSLLLQGAPFTANWLGMSPLHYACINGHLGSAQILTRAGVSWDGRTKVDKTPMHFAAQFGHLSIVSMLIGFGADVNAKDMLEMTPLHWAVVEQHFAIVKLLVSNQAVITTKNKFEKSPVESASAACDYRMVEYLKCCLGNGDTIRDDASSSPVQDDTSESESLQSSTISDQHPWLQHDILSQNVASGASVLLEGANAITLTEGGKLAWSHLFEQDQSLKKEEKEIEFVLPSSLADDGQKVLSMKLANQMLNGSNGGNQPFTIVVAPKKNTVLKSPPSKRKKHNITVFEQPRDIFTTIEVTQEDALQRQLEAAQSEVEIYREKLFRKEQEATLWKQQLEKLQQSRR